MLAIRDDYIGNRLSEKFISPCHINYFINDDIWKLTAGYIYRTLYFRWLNFVFLFFRDTFINELHTKEIIYLNNNPNNIESPNGLGPRFFRKEIIKHVLGNLLESIWNYFF